MSDSEELSQPVLLAPKHVPSEMSIQGGGQKIAFGLVTPRKNQPVHEQMTVAALVLSDYRLDPANTFVNLRDESWARPEHKDFIRGVMWNDDPECVLFKEDSTSNNLDYSTGAEWATKYGKAAIFSSGREELIGRSHYGDLQWLHAMGSTAGEAPTKTKDLILQWIEIMYNVATGVTSADTRIHDTWLKDWFNTTSLYGTVGELLTQKHKSPAYVPHRALGSCFHVIQDSYAIGHTHREALNPQDRLPGHDLKYKDGVADRWGAVENFHTYKGQSDEHKHYDHSDDNVTSIDLRNVNAWNGLVGCRDGVEACVKLANFWHRKAPWKEVHDWLDGEVFRLSSSATPSDNTVN